MVKRISGNDFPVVFEDRRPGDIASLTANAHRLMSRLSWKPKHDNLEKIVRDALAWEAALDNRRKSA